MAHKFDRDLIEKLTLQKIREVNKEAGYRSYLEVPEMVEVICSVIEQNLNMSKQSRNLMSELEEGLEYLAERRLMTRDQLLKDYAKIIDEQKEEITILRKVISDIATNLGNGSVVSTEASLPFIQDLPGEVKSVCNELRRQKNYLSSIATTALAEIPTSYIPDHTLDNLPKLVKSIVKDSVEDAEELEHHHSLIEDIRASLLRFPY